MAEDDDDEAFGDFAFAPFQSNPQSNGLNSSAAADEDDDWGDFVRPPQQSKPSEPSFNGNHRSENSASPSAWVKPSGALPLSIFGDDEEKGVEAADSDVDGDLNQGKSNGIAGGFNFTKVNNGVTNSHSFGIADLYNQYSQSKPENRAGSDSTGKADLVENGSFSSSNQNDARSAVNELKYVDLNDMLGKSDHNQLKDNSEIDEFSFKSYAPDPHAKEDLFGGWTQEFNGFSSNLIATPQNVPTSSSELDVNRQKQQLDGIATAIDDDGDDDDDGWEFRDANSESRGQEVNNNNDARSAVTELKNADLNNALGINDRNQVKSKTDNDEFSLKSYVPDPREKEDLFGGWMGEFNGFSSSLNTTPQNIQISSSDVDMNGQRQQLDGSATAIDDDDDDDDAGWEFRDAYSESKAQEVHNDVNWMLHEVSERSAYSSGTGIDSKKSLDLFGTLNGSIDFFATEPADYFANLGGIPSTSQEVDLVGIQPSTATLNGFTSDTHSIIEQNNDKGLFNHRADVVIEELDEDFGDFTAASAETGPKPGEKETKSNYHKGAIPLSIFGNEEPESGGSSDVQDVFMHQSTFQQKNNHTAAKVVSINDLISNLYSQAEQTSSVNTAQNPTENLLNLSGADSSSNVVNDDDLLNDSSWDFKDASQMRVDSEASLSSTGDTYISISSKLKLNNYLDFYCKLKEELYFVTKRQIESLKQARSNVALSSEDAGAAPYDGELEMVCKELEQMNFHSEESDPSGESHLNEFAQVLLEPQFQRLESEYHLSHKMLLVEKDLGSAMELIRHTNTMLKILTTGTSEEQKVYVSLWSEMISACAQELKHGASIWNQAAEKHVRSQLLSEPQGRKFVSALGEIYRVVVVLGASAELFKPWILSGSVDSPAIYTLLEECHAVWSTSGLEEALSSISAPITLENTSLFKSIKHIQGLDAIKLQNYVSAEKQSRCRLSMLTAGVVPDLKMIMWENEQCFVSLANLWANLISRDPPKLPQLNLG